MPARSSVAQKPNTLAGKEKEDNTGHRLLCRERLALANTGMRMRSTDLPNILRFQETKYYCVRGARRRFYKGFTFWK